MNNQRRMFRGRGGPNDRRLPKYNARRRRRHVTAANEQNLEPEVPSQTLQQEEKETTIEEDESLWTTDEECEESDHDENGASSGEKEEENLIANSPASSPSMRNTDNSDTFNEDVACTTKQPINENNVESIRDTVIICNDSEENTTLAHDDAVMNHDDEQRFRSEIRHLQKRIQNNRQSFSLATHKKKKVNQGLTNLDSYQMNVLNAAENCFQEWKSILQRYQHTRFVAGDVHDGGNAGNDSKNVPPTSILSLLSPSLLFRQVGQALFELLQQALQTGPLTGSNPGYFKRCGSAVATMVHAFLCRVLSIINNTATLETTTTRSTTRSDTNDLHNDASLHFTEKQRAVLDKWKHAAEKSAAATTTAVGNDENEGKPPSKSVQKKFHEAEQQRQRKQELQEKKNLRRRR